MGLLDTAKWLLREALLDGDKLSEIFDVDHPDVPEEDSDDDGGTMSGHEALRALARAELEQLRRDNEKLGLDNERLTRINSEYFTCIESMERQRDEWKEMFFTHSSEHQVAQSMIRDSLNQVGQQLRAAIVQLNLYRKAAGHVAIVEPKCLKEAPTDIPEDFKKRMDDLVASKKEPDTDGKAERKAIDEANAG